MTRRRSKVHAGLRNMVTELTTSTSNPEVDVDSCRDLCWQDQSIVSVELAVVIAIETDAHTRAWRHGGKRDSAIGRLRDEREE